jgi:hypothetical protein
MFYEQGIEDIGVIQAHHIMGNTSKPVQVASVQTLMRRDMPECDLVIVDECHRWFTIYETWLSQDKGWKVPVIGLSATPWTRGPFIADNCRNIPTCVASIISGHVSSMIIYLLRLLTFTRAILPITLAVALTVDARRSRS